MNAVSGFECYAGTQQVDGTLAAITGQQNQSALSLSGRSGVTVRSTAELLGVVASRLNLGGKPLVIGGGFAVL